GQKKRRPFHWVPRFTRLGLERLEDRLAPAAPAPISVLGAATTIDLSTLTPASANILTLGPGSAPGKLNITSNNGTFTSTDFLDPTGSLTTKLGNQGDTLTINAPDPAFNASLTVTGGTGDDSITVNSLTGSGAYSINAGNGNDVFTVGQITGSTL